MQAGLMDGCSITIRQGKSDDLPALLGIWRGAVEATHAFLTPADMDWYQNIVTTYIPRMRDLRVGETNIGTVVGFIAQDEGDIHMLFVDPLHQGRGIGTQLLEHVGALFVVLNVDVNEQNPAGRRFYQARGFTQVGRSELDGEGRNFPILHLRRQRIVALKPNGA